MIDTVVINLEPRSYNLLTEADSMPWQLHSRREGFSKYVKTLSSAQRKDGIYRPRIRGIHRGRGKIIQVELSLPKLIYGNNVDELTDKDFGLVLKTLSERLIEQGVIISPAHLRKCVVSVVHYSKNISLGHYSVSDVLTKMARVKVPGFMDVTRDRYTNDGHVLHLYTKAHSMVAYDKMKDIVKPKSRSIDKDQSTQQMSLFTKQPELRETQMLRIEIRLAKKKKVQEVLNKKDPKESVTFEQAFSERVSSQVLKDYWSTYMTNSALQFSEIRSPLTIAKMLSHKGTPNNAKDLIYLTGLCLLSQDENGLTELRGLIERNYSRQTWYRVSKDCKRLNELMIDYQEQWVRKVEDGIKNYSPYKLSYVHTDEYLDVKYCKV